MTLTRQQLMDSTLVAVDTETTGLNPHGSLLSKGVAPARPFAFSFSTPEGDYYIRFRVDPYTRAVMYDEQLEDYLFLCEFFSKERLIIMHNSLFDLMMLHVISIEVPTEWVMDTLIMAHLARPTARHGLKPLCKAMFGFPDDDMKDLKDAVKKARREGKKLGYALAEDVEADYHLAPPEFCEIYAIRDTQRTLKLYNAFQPLLEAQEGRYESYRALVAMEHNLVPMALQMALNGVCVDTHKLDELEDYYKTIIEAKIAEKGELGYADLNHGSPAALKEVFYGDLGMNPEMRKRKIKGKGTKKTLSVDKAALEKWSGANPLSACLLELGAAEHQLQSFILPFRELSYAHDGINTLHPNFRTLGAITGRFSCTNPNLQNVSSATSAGRKAKDVEYRARECFVPKPGNKWLLCDYGQIEIWCMAFLSQDKVMMKALLEGESLHDITCRSLFNIDKDSPLWESKRKMAKNINFALQYGAQAGQIAGMLGIGFQEAQILVAKYFHTYSGVAAYSKALEKQHAEEGYVLNPYGRAYNVEDPRFTYKLANYVVQGTAAEIIKRAMLKVKWLFWDEYPDWRIALQVHDELIMEGPEVTEKLIDDVKKAMQSDFHIILGMPRPFEVEACISTTNWAHKEKV